MDNHECNVAEVLEIYSFKGSPPPFKALNAAENRVKDEKNVVLRILYKFELF